MDCGPFFSDTRAVGMYLDTGAVETKRLDFDSNNLVSLQLFEHTVQNAVLRPSVHSRVDRVPIAEPLRQTTPLAAVLCHIQDAVEHLQIRKTDIAPLLRKWRRNTVVLSFCKFHPFASPIDYSTKRRKMGLTYSYQIVLTRSKLLFRRKSLREDEFALSRWDWAESYQQNGRATWLAGAR